MKTAFFSVLFFLFIFSAPSQAQQETFNKRFHLGFPVTVFASVIAGWQGQQGWLVKVDQHGCLVPGCHETSPADAGPSAGPRLLLFPNPVGDYLNVFLKDPALPQRSGAAFRILDAQGRLLAAYPAGRLEGATSILPVQALTAGAYVLQYVDGQGVLWSGRFVKQ